MNVAAPPLLLLACGHEHELPVCEADRPRGVVWCWTCCTWQAHAGTIL